MREENRMLRLSPWVRYYALTESQLENLKIAGRALQELSKSLESDSKTRHQIVHLSIMGMVTSLKAIKRYCREELGVKK